MSEETIKLSRNQKLLIGAILLSAFTGIVIGFMRRQGIDSTALLYIGVPTCLALVFSTTPSAKSVVGTTLKSITFIILISGPLLQEGFICMIMAAPIFYIVGALAAWPFDHYRKKREKGQDASKLNMVVLPALLLMMSMEGVTEYTTFNRYNTIEHSEIVDGTISEVKTKLATNRVLPSPNSLFAKIFPRPDIVHSQGLSVGDKHWIDVSYFKWIYWNEKKGSTYFVVTENKQDYIKFKPDSDTSYFHSYLDWGETIVSFEKMSDYRTRVSWKINFIRKIDPAWYVQPLQRYAVDVLAKTMIASLK